MKYEDFVLSRVLPTFLLIFTALGLLLFGRVIWLLF